MKTDKTLELDKEYVVSKSIPIFPKCGIYFLIKDSEIVYVGQSIHIHGRVKTHQKDKEFDRVFFVGCTRDELNQLEAKYIRQFEPRLNRTLPDPNRKLRPHSKGVKEESPNCIHYPENGYLSNRPCKAGRNIREFGEHAPCWDNTVKGCPFAQYDPQQAKK